MTVLFENERVKNSEDENVHISFDKGWNDYGLHMLYNFKYKDLITNYRILAFKTEADNFLYYKDETEFSDINDLLDKNKTTCFYGFALDTEFYDKLHSLTDSCEQFNEILEKLHDITTSKYNQMFDNFIEDLTESARINYLENSLFRYGAVAFELSKFLEKIDSNYSKFIFNGKKIESKSVETDLFIDEFKKILYQDNWEIWQHSDELENDEKKEVLKAIILGLDDFIIALSSLSNDDKAKLWEIVKKDTVFVNDIAKLFGNEDDMIKVEVDKILKELTVSKIEELPDSLGQYTPLNTLKYLFLRNSDNNEDIEKNLENIPSLRLTNGNQLNDPKEGKLLFSLIGVSKNNIPYNDTRNYMASTTVAKDSLPLWNLYAENATGVFTIFDDEYVNKLIEKRLLYKVCYIEINAKKGFTAYVNGKKNKTIKNCISFIKKDVLNGKVSQEKIIRYCDIIKFLFKKIDYNYEAEYRILKSNTQTVEISFENKDNNKYILHSYLFDDNKEKVRVKYKEIVVGPRSIENIAFIGEYIKWLDNNVKVSCSNISYR